MVMHIVDTRHPRIALIVTLTMIPFICLGFFVGMIAIGIIAGFQVASKCIDWITGEKKNG